MLSSTSTAWMRRAAASAGWSMRGWKGTSSLSRSWRTSGGTSGWLGARAASVMADRRVSGKPEYTQIIAAIWSPIRGLTRASSHLAVMLPVAQPAFQQRADVGRPAFQQFTGGIAYCRQQIGVAHQVGDLELQQAGLAGAEHLPGAAQLQILLGDHEAVVGVAHDRQALAADLRERRMVEQHAVAGRAAPADPSAQLVQLGQAEALRVLDDHQAGVGHVDADLDHRGGDQQVEPALLELVHHRSLLGRLQAPVDQPDAQLAKRRGKLLVGALRGLAGEFLGLLDQGADPVGLAALAAGGADPLDHLDAAA